MVVKNSLSKTRNDHSTEIAEDYVEAIADSIELNGICRCVNLVEKFSVTNATVNRTISRLVRDGYVRTEPYQPVDLTAKGRKLAMECKKRHQIVESFLLALGVSSAVAAADSEGIEHHVSKETLEAMKKALSLGILPNKSMFAGK
jgi:DtxR family transcriptional regulator, manganese transport regulator